MKKAFSMLELLFVIVVIGILAVAIIPSMKTDKLREAAIQLVSHIRYTQHLAMSDSKFSDNDAGWYKKRWTIVFNKDDYTSNEYAYTIFTDINGVSSGNPDLGEVAINPQNHSLVLSGGFSGANGLDIRNSSEFKGTKKLNIGIAYNINDVVFSNECSFSGSKRISFDNFGRPLKGKMSSYSQAYKKNRLISGVCKITLVNNNEGNITIAINPETGYTYIL